jgi:L-fuconolactonase
MKVDAHQHFWHYNTAEYGWIDDSMSRLQRDFMPADLAREIRPLGLDGVVAVEARQTLEETRWLLKLADEQDFIRGVVGWVPLADPKLRDHLDALADQPALKGVRHVVQDEPDDDFILGDAFNAGVAALAECQLTYDILIFERHLPQAIQFVDRHPQQVFVLDHLAKPRVKQHELEPWRARLRALAERENVYCKLSGMVTEADWQAWTEPQLLPYLETALEAFGPQRLMFGSDWPVSLLACKYQAWYDIVERFSGRLSADEQARLFGGTAAEAYRLIQ